MVGDVRTPSPSERSLLLDSPTGPVPLGFVQEGDVVHLVAREGSARWPVEVLRQGAAVLRLEGGTRTGVPQLVVDDQERARILGLFLEKYGADQYGRWYDHPRRVLSIRPGSDARPDHYFEWLTAEFDNIAAEYDQHILGNRMNRLLRDRSLALLRATFRPSDRLLELGCGSGMETMQLLQDGHEILAVDISEKMLEVVRAKARAAGVAERFSGIRSRASELGALVPALGGPFDGAYSTYGALNCEPDLTPVARALGELVPPGRPFVGGIYNRWCLFEILGYGATFQWDRALGRRANPVPVGASRFCVDTYAYSVPEFIARFRPWFESERLLGVPVVLPPSDLTSYAEQFSRRFDRLAALDRALGGVWPLSTLGDHFLVVLRRATGPMSAAPSAMAKPSAVSGA